MGHNGRSVMKKVGNQIVARVKMWMQTDQDWERQPHFMRHMAHRLTVNEDGRVVSWVMGEIPLDWTQRRSVARAYKHAHTRITEKLIKAGEQALKAQKRS